MSDSQEQKTFNLNSGPEEKSSKFLIVIIIAIIVVAIMISAGIIVIYHPTTSSIKESKTLWAAGSFQMQVTQSGEQYVYGQVFTVYDNMTNVHIYGSFTSNKTVSCVIGFLGHMNSSLTYLPVITKYIWSSGNTKGRSIFACLQTPSSSQISESYVIQFNDTNPQFTEVNVTSSIIMTYYSS
jgi:hypothetical protein